jgi:hypothetical protein
MKTNSKFTMVATTVILAGLLAGSAQGYWNFIFTDNFDGGASLLWGNESGDWLASGGVYYAQAPSNNPHIHNFLPFNLRDFAIDVDIRGVNDGGIWLRSDDAGHGVLLAINAPWNKGLYWHNMRGFGHGDAEPRYSVVNDLFNVGDSIHLRIEVVGNTYSAFLNGSATPATMFVNYDHYSGHMGLYSRSGQTFDNFVLTTLTIPEPATLALLGLGSLILVRWRRG